MGFPVPLKEWFGGPAKEFVADTLLSETCRRRGVFNPSAFKEIFEKLYARGAFMVMKNTLGLKSKEFEELKIEAKPAEDVEEKLMREHIGQIKLDGKTPEQELQLIRELMHTLNAEKQEGETNYVFADRIKSNAMKVLNLYGIA